MKKKSNNNSIPLNFSMMNPNKKRKLGTPNVENKNPIKPDIASAYMYNQNNQTKKTKNK